MNRITVRRVASNVTIVIALVVLILFLRWAVTGTQNLSQAQEGTAEGVGRFAITDNMNATAPSAADYLKAYMMKKREYYLYRKDQRNRHVP